MGPVYLTQKADSGTLHRAAALLTVRELDEERRELVGVASLPVTDRVGDVVVSSGVTAKNPIPLLLGHDHQLPVGKTWLDPRSDSVRFRASIAKVRERGRLQERCDEAWQAAREGLLPAVSVGFRVLDAEPLPNGGTRFLRTEVLELSLCAVGACPGAVVTGVRSIDRQLQGEYIGAGELRLDEFRGQVKAAIASGDPQAVLRLFDESRKERRREARARLAGGFGWSAEDLKRPATRALLLTAIAQLQDDARRDRAVNTARQVGTVKLLSAASVHKNAGGVPLLSASGAATPYVPGVPLIRAR